MEAQVRFELTLTVLQTAALPLGYCAYVFGPPEWIWTTDQCLIKTLLYRWATGGYVAVSMRFELILQDS